jgi:protein-tyrosine phosphatase
VSHPRILFVCTGNICRSPTAEGVLLHRAREAGLELVVDSAGTSAEEMGNPPDARARRVAEARGYLLPDRRARQIRANDFITFDRILAMTGAHLRTLERRAPAETTARLELFMTHAPGHGIMDVPDPWYGGLADYEHALDLIEAGVEGLLRALRAAR